MPSILSRLLEQLPVSSRKHEIFSPQVRASLPLTRHSWERTLCANTDFWGRLAESERALRGEIPLSMPLVRSLSTSMCVAVFAVLREMRELAGRNPNELEEAFRTLCSRIQAAMIPAEPAQMGLTLDLCDVNLETVQSVGTKAAFLGETQRHCPDWLVPKGFVITAAAHRLFLEHRGLQEEINRRLQIQESDALVDRFRLSSEIQLLLINAPLPEPLEASVRSAYRALEAATGHRGVRVALRSSCLGEDAPEPSFAGQHRTELNVGEDLLLMAYKEILASQYGAAAMNYRLNRGLRVENHLMSVICTAMVETAVSGMISTRHPVSQGSDDVHVSAVHGLAKAISEGYVEPDIWEVARDPAPCIRTRRVREKPERFVGFLSEEGVSLLPNPPSQRGHPALDNDQVLALTGLGMNLEKHFKRPVNIEWSLSKDGGFSVLQVRPAHQPLEPTPHHAIESAARETPSDRGPETDSNTGLNHLARESVTAAPGAASGPVFVVRTNNDLLHFPAGAVLVAARPLLRWSAIVPQAAALVTESCGVFSHLASMAREFSVPALFNVPNATSALRNGQKIMVDATRRRLHVLPEGARKQTLRNGRPSLSRTPVGETLAAILATAKPLSRVNPLDPRIAPESVQSLRDLAQIGQLLACRQILKLTRIAGILRPLAVHHPINWWVLDLEDSRLGTDSDHLSPPTPLLPDQAPMLGALWSGIAQGVWTRYANSPRQFRLLRLLRRLRASVRPLSAPKPRVFVVTEETTHLYLALERALFCIQIQTGALPKNNSTCLLWQWFGPKQPGSDERKNLAGLFQSRDFSVDLAGDGLFAWSTGHDLINTSRRARFLGYMISHVQHPGCSRNIPADVDVSPGSEPTALK